VGGVLCVVRGPRDDFAAVSGLPCGWWWAEQRIACSKANRILQLGAPGPVRCVPLAESGKGKSWPWAHASRAQIAAESSIIVDRLSSTSLPRYHFSVSLSLPTGWSHSYALSYPLFLPRPAYLLYVCRYKTPMIPCPARRESSRQLCTTALPLPQYHTT
jgi:hypothetical protein